MFNKSLSVVLIFLIALYGSMYPSISSAQNSRNYTLAVLDLEPNGVSQIEARGLSDKLRSHISQLIQNDSNIKIKYELIERTQMDKIFEQFEIQNTGCVSDSCAVEFGKMLQCDRIVIGTVSLIGQTYSAIARIVDVESGRTLRSADRQYKGFIDDVLISIIPQVGYELLTGIQLFTIADVNFITKYKLSIQPGISAISINGTPQKVEVYINGENYGLTPLRNKKMSPGNYSISITRKGYEELINEINVKSGNTTEITYNLKLLHGTISIQGSTEEATVFLDGQEMGETPLLDHMVPIGNYTVKIKKNGYKDYTKKITVKNDALSTFSYTLIPKKDSSILKKSLIFPGSGQRYAGYKWKGEIITFLQFAAIIGIVISKQNYSSAKNDYINFSTKENYDAKSITNTHQNIAIAAASVVYIWNVIDAFYINSKVEVKPKLNSLRIKPHIEYCNSGIYAFIKF